MIKYLFKRLGQSIFTLVIIITVVFLLLRLMPEEGYLGTNADKMSDVQKETILTNLGLRDPIIVQIGKFYKNIATGDFGKSITYRPDVKVSTILAQKIPYSLCFGLVAVGLSLVCGVAMGIIMARSKNSLFDKLGTGYIVFINAVPAAVYYLVIQLYVTNTLKLPILFDKSNFVSWILPAISMSLGNTAGYAMWMRRYMVDELNSDYVKLARAKGVSEKNIMVHHVLRNAFVPMAQYLPASILYTIAGSIYIESLYSIPGMGGLLVDAIQRQDNPLVQGLVIIYSSLGILGLILGDIAMTLADPRIKLEKSGGGR
jgi:oligopeptide transport system permease protein